MKDSKKLDELLNGYIDDQLDQRQQTEIKRLLAHDETIARRLRELQACRDIVNSLPTEQAPDNVLYDVMASLERRSLLGLDDEITQHKKGAVQLFFRKVLAAAAMFMLLAALGYVIYDIVGPSKLSNNSTMTAYNSVDTLVTAKNEKLKASLELKTDSFRGAIAIIDRAIAAGSLAASSSSSQSQPQTSVRNISCSPEQFAALVTDIEPLWNTLSSARLHLETPDTDKLTVNSVKPQQIISIANQRTTTESITLASDIAAFNNRQELLRGGNEKFDPTSIPGRIPKPVLTGAEETTKKPLTSKSDQNIELTIIVTGK